jgi:hypothetical protein
MSCLENERVYREFKLSQDARAKKIAKLTAKSRDLQKVQTFLTGIRLTMEHIVHHIDVKLSHPGFLGDAKRLLGSTVTLAVTKVKVISPFTDNNLAGVYQNYKYNFSRMTVEGFLGHINQLQLFIANGKKMSETEFDAEQQRLAYVGSVMEYDLLLKTKTGQSLKDLVAFVYNQPTKRVREESIKKLYDKLNEFRTVTMDAKQFLRCIKENDVIEYMYDTVRWERERVHSVDEERSHTKTTVISTSKVGLVLELLKRILELSLKKMDMELQLVKEEAQCLLSLSHLNQL